MTTGRAAYTPGEHWHDTKTGAKHNRLPKTIGGRGFQPCTEWAVHRAYMKLLEAGSRAQTPGPVVEE